MEYTYNSELIFWPYWGKFVNQKEVKITSLVALQVAKYMTAKK